MKNTTSTFKTIKTYALNNLVNIFFFILAIYTILVNTTLDNSNPEIVFFDVGQGDAVLIQQGDFQILVDGGADRTILSKLSKYMPLYDKNIEIVVLTHPHDDHIRGLIYVLQRYDVDMILINPITYSNQSYEYLLENYEGKIKHTVEEDHIKYADIEIKTLYPFIESRVQDRNINNESVVLLLEIKNYRTLLMGDAEHEVEKKILNKIELPKIDTLKVGHHCSRTSTSDMFLRTTKPSLAICSCGDNNKFGHPHYETLEKLTNHNVQYLITYKEGDIIIKL